MRGSRVRTGSVARARGQAIPRLRAEGRVSRRVQSLAWLGSLAWDLA